MSRLYSQPLLHITDDCEGVLTIEFVSYIYGPDPLLSIIKIHSDDVQQFAESIIEAANLSLSSQE